MKKFSLKALGASLLTLGLIVAGAAVPAQAADGVTMITNPAPTFDTNSSTTPAFEIAVERGAGFRDFNNQTSGVQLTININSFNYKNGCATSFTPLASSGCGIASISGTNIGTPQVKSSGFGDLQFTGLETATRVTIEFEANAFRTGGSSGTMIMNVKTGLNTTVGTLGLTVNAPPPPPSYTVTFDSNGGTGTMASQTSSTPRPLNNNTFTKTGTSFQGWATSCSGPKVYNNTGNYSFSASATLFAVWADGSNSCSGGGGSSTPAATITLGATQGQLVAGSSVAIVASGLQATAPYTVVVQSTPQTIGSGNAVSGAVSTSVTLPSNLGAGWHTLTFSSTASDGSPMTSVLYFEVSSTGTLLATSSTKPAALANTGFDAVPFIASGVALMILGAGVMLVARRKSA